MGFIEHFSPLHRYLIGSIDVSSRDCLPSHLTVSGPHFLEVVVIDCLPSPGLSVCNRAPQLEDEVVRETEGLEVRVVDCLGQLHRVALPLRQVPDLRS